MKLSQLSTCTVRLIVAALPLLLGTAGSANAGVIFQDGFESRDLSHTENGVSWSGSAKTKVTNLMNNTGSYSLLFPYPGDGVGNPESPDSWAEQRFDLGKGYTELWYKFNVFFPSNYTHRQSSGSSNDKFLIMWNKTGGSSSGNSRLYIDFESWGTTDSSWGSTGSSYAALHLKYNGVDYGHDHPQDNLYGQTPDPASIFRAPDDAGKWHEFIIHIKLASSATAKDGVAEIWKNGVKEMEYLHLPIYDTQANYIDQGYLLGWSNSGFNQQTNIYVDDFVVSTSPITPGGIDTGGELEAPTIRLCPTANPC